MAQNQAVGLGEFSNFINKALCPLYLLHFFVNLWRWEKILVITDNIMKQGTMATL